MRVMKTAVLRAVRSMEIGTVPVPEPSERQILVKTGMCGICGSDMAAFHGISHRDFPYSPGHEFWGTVVKKGEAVCGFSEGESVLVDPNLGCGECGYCRDGRPNLCDNLKTRRTKSNGGFSEFVALDCRMAHRMPAALIGAKAVFVEPLSCAVHTVRRIGLKNHGTVAVFGAGCMGLLAGVVLKRGGFQAVFSEPLENRREDARGILGFEAFSPDDFNAKYGRQSFDFALDCSGDCRAIGQAIGCLKKGGKLGLSGIAGDCGVNDIRVSDIASRELEILGAWLNPATFPEAISIAVESARILDRFAVAYIGMDGLVQALETGMDRRVIKTIVRF
jgi:2-desacetyl-2-hydroxyethyl bacteriochlorophyllide A dehydrogenase